MLLDLLQIFINNIAPILLAALIGYIVGKQLRIDPKPIGSLIFYIFSPMLIFDSLYNSTVGGDELLVLAGATIGFQLVMIGLAWGTTAWLGVPPVQRANITLSSFALNAGNYGLPLVTFAFGEEVLSRALVVMVANTFTNYTLGVYIASNGTASAKQALMNVLRTPGMYAIILAFGLRSLAVTIPIPLERTTSLLAEASIPLMLIMLGLQLGRKARPVRKVWVGTSVVLKLLVAPIVATGITFLLGITGLAQIAIIAQCSMPTAVATIIFATEFDLDRDLALNVILATTLISPLTLSPLIWFLQQGM
jgi:predicted permease